MTKQEAVDYIKNLKDGIVQRHVQGCLESKVIMNSSAVEALNMAIKSLEVDIACETILAQNIMLPVRLMTVGLPKAEKTEIENGWR